MQTIIILKGKRSSGKSSSLRNLRKLLGSNDNRMTILYKGLVITIRLMSIHENFNWDEVIDTIVSYTDDVIVLAAWEDEIINESQFINRKLEDIIKERAPRKFQFHVVHTKYIEDSNRSEITSDNLKCAKGIKRIIDDISMKKHEK
jgi:hypothetical protein